MTDPQVTAATPPPNIGGRAKSLTLALPPERYTTLGLHHGMHVHESSLSEPEHVVDQVRYVGNGDWAVSFSDSPALVVCGARHAWVEEQA